MKRLAQYIIENIQPMFEAKFKDREWVCGQNQIEDYHYAIAVLNKIIDKQPIRLGINKNSGLQEITVDNEDKISMVKKLKDKLISQLDNKNVTLTANDFNKLDLGFKWTDIFKGDFSGVTGRGSNGQIYESLVAHLYNTENYSEENIQNWANLFNVNLESSWINSSIYSAKLLINLTNNKYNGTEFIAFHVDGQNYEDDFKDIPQNILQKMLKIANIFTGKYNNQSITGGLQKDKWNPSDIVLITKNENNLDKFLDKCEAAGKGKSFNAEVIQNAIVEAISDEHILGISLKKITKDGKIYGHNIKDAEYIDNEYSIDDVKLQLAKTYDKPGRSGSMWVVGVNANNGNDAAQVQFRCQTEENGNLSIEARLSNNKYARGGKGITIIKRKLGIISNEYYLDIKSDDDLLKLFDKYGCTDVDGNHITKDKIIGGYKKVCFKGFFGLLEKYSKETLKNENINPLVAFAQYCWAACVDCPSSYYIIK